MHKKNYLEVSHNFSVKKLNIHRDKNNSFLKTSKSKFENIDEKQRMQHKKYNNKQLDEKRKLSNSGKLRTKSFFLTTTYISF